MNEDECIDQAISYLDSERCLTDNSIKSNQIRIIIEFLETIKEN